MTAAELQSYKDLVVRPGILRSGECRYAMEKLIAEVAEARRERDQALGEALEYFNRANALQCALEESRAQLAELEAKLKRMGIRLRP